MKISLHNMKHYLLPLLVICLLLPSCKQDEWTDWKTQNAAWLLQNAECEGVQVTPTGLQYKVLEPGIAGVRPDDIKTVRVSYTGKLITGYVFEQNDNATFAVSGVVDGFREGLKKMHKSGRYIFYIPQELAYGKEEKGVRGYQSYIPPYSTLIFEVTLLDVY